MVRQRDTDTAEEPQCRSTFIQWESDSKLAGYEADTEELSQAKEKHYNS